MCGITGFLSFSDLYTNNIAENATVMADAIAHRGRDKNGIWIDEKHGIALAHKRLATLDLSSVAAQPMHSKNDQKILIFNGMISNFKSLRTEMEKQKNVVFSSTSDTEVLLQLIEQNGMFKAVQKLEGMFAFALWDNEKETLSLVRDSVGIKPLYYAEMDGVFLFGSELKAIKKHPAFTKEIDQKSLAFYLKYNFIPAPFSIYKNTKKLPTGTILTIDKKGKKYITSYKEKTCNNNKITTEKQLHKILEKSVKDNLVSDVPVGVLLSGGIDSSLIAALAQKQQNIHTFSIGFQEKNYDESLYAKKIASHIGATHHNILFDAKSLPSLIEKTVEIYDEPFGDVSALPTILLAEHVTKHGIKVALSGDGGDEVFLGYNRYIFGKKLGSIPFFIRKILAKIIDFYPSIFWEMAEKMSSKIPPQLDEKIQKLQQALKAKSVKDIYESLLTKRPYIDAEDVLPSPSECRGKITSKCLKNKVLSYFNYADFEFYLPDDVLTKVDRASMAYGLEVRVPFLNKQVIDAGFSLSFKHRMQKKILKKILKKYFPKNIFDRPKKGFAVPIGKHLRTDINLKNWAENLLNEQKLIETGLPAEKILDSWKKLQNGQDNYQHDIWGILMLLLWLENQL